MQLTALEIQGFKSFPDKIKIGIGKGITVVVGPNGSGKSNISDAIRWVLGETSSKQLRGGGKMEDVIFGGTQLRSAMGFASVNLYIDNKDRRIDIETDEVVIGRKYYRSGDSEYGINGQNVRLKDIYELFLDTGIGRDGYSIIGQGRIAEIVGAKSGERREIFEEASGIAKYRYRKNEAERRLKASEDNLLRLSDILNELEERVGPLEKECKKAEKFLEFSARKKELEITLWYDTIHRAKETVREQNKKIEISKNDYDNASAKIDEIENSTREVRREIEQYIMEIESYNTDIRTITEQASGSDAQLAVLENNILRNTETMASIKEQISLSDSNSQEISKEIKSHENEIEKGETTLIASDEKILELENSLKSLSEKSRATGERKGELSARLTEIQTEISNLRVEIAQGQSVVENSETRLATVETQLTDTVEKTQEFEKEKAENLKFAQEINSKLTTLTNIKEALCLKLNNREKRLEEALQEQRKTENNMQSTAQRIQMLKDLENNMDGFVHSVKTVMKSAKNNRLKGVIGPVSTILTVENGYEIAIETALGFALQNIIVENESAAKAGMALLKDERAGRATFLPLDTIKRDGDYNFGTLQGSACPATKLVKYDLRFDHIIKSLLGRILIASDINEASRIAKNAGYKYRIVTIDGQVINAGGSFTGGSTSKTTGLFSRKQEISDLAVKYDKLKVLRQTQNSDSDKIRLDADNLKAQLTATEGEIITLNGDKIRCEVEVQRIDLSLGQYLSGNELLQGEKEELLKKINTAKTTSLQNEDKINLLNDKFIIFEKEMTGIEGTDEDFVSARNDLTDAMSVARLDKLKIENEISLHKHSLENLYSRTGEAQEQLALQSLNIERLTQQNIQHEDMIAKLKEEKVSLAQKIADYETAIEKAGSMRLEKEKSITQQNNQSKEISYQREELSKEMARLTERMAALETQYDQTVAKLWEEYELTPAVAQGLCIEFENLTQLRSLTSEIRNKIRALGNVNVGAIEEYAEVSERYNFLNAQVTDVQNAKAELVKLINELSTEMRNIFSESFAQINEHFGRIFTELFGGGHAHLSLSDNEDILESGIDIHVAPPGKIIKNLSSLSGGEQALVAISIYFAILAVNPAPFCVLDEIEAALDDVNVTRYAQFLRRISNITQFIVISHRRGTMEEADVLYGVTMQEDGVSKLLKLDMEDVGAHLIK